MTLSILDKIYIGFCITEFEAYIRFLREYKLKLSKFGDNHCSGT